MILIIQNYFTKTTWKKVKSNTRLFTPLPSVNCHLFFWDSTGTNTIRDKLEKLNIYHFLRFLNFDFYCCKPRNMTLLFFKKTVALLKLHYILEWSQTELQFTCNLLSLYIWENLGKRYFTILSWNIIRLHNGLLSRCIKCRRNLSSSLLRQTTMPLM